MGTLEVKTEVTGAVWKFVAEIGDKVREGDELAILESMKMEIPVLAPTDGIVVEFTAKEGDVRNEGETVVILKV